MLHVLVTMMVKEGRMQEFLDVCRELRPKVLQETGCRGYEYMREMPSVLGIQEPSDPNRVTLIECWESVEALKAHMETPHMKEAGPKMRELRAGAVARVVEPIF